MEVSMSQRVQMGLAIALGAMFTASNATAQVICVDPAGPRGVSGCDTNEAPLMLNIAKNLTKYLKTAGFEVRQTRTSSSSMAESQRIEICQGATATVSIVANSYTSSAANGIEVYHNGKGKAATLGNAIIDSAASNMKMAKRQSQSASNYSMLNTLNTAAMKVYLGFITSCSKDVPAMKDSEGYAKALCRAIATTYGKNAQGCVDSGDLHVEVVSNGTRIPGATVSLVHLSSQQSKKTDSGGTALFKLAVGSYIVSVSAQGYEHGEGRCTVVADKTSICEISIEPSTGTIWGNVISETTGQPPSGHVSLSVTPQTDISFDGVKWRIVSKPGSYTIVATHDQYYSGSTKCNIINGNVQQCDTISLKPKPGKLQGRVKCEGNDFAATIKIKGQEDIGYTGGTWTSAELTAGVYTVTAEVSGATPTCTGATVNCQVTPGNTTDCSIDLPKRDIKPGTLEGTVTDATTGQKLAAIVSGNGPQTLSQKCDENTGIFKTDGVAPGDYTLTASLDGYESGASVTCSVEEAQHTTGCDIELQRVGGKICFKVNADEELMPSVVTLFDINKGTGTEVGKDESVKRSACFGGLRGKYKAIATSLTEGAFEEQEVDIEAPKGGSIEYIFEVEKKVFKSHYLQGTVKSSLNEDVIVNATVSVDNLGSQDYDGSEEWRFRTPVGGVHTVKAVPKSPEQYRPGEADCIVDSPCVVVLEPIIPDVDLPAEEDVTKGNATVDVMVYGDSCQSTPRSRHAQGAWWLLLCGGAAAAWGYRRRRLL